MTQIIYLAREIINNQVHDTTKFQTSARILQKESKLTINYQENLPEGKFCQITYNGNDLIIIKRFIYENDANVLIIQNGKLISNKYFTLAGTTTLFTFGKEISMLHLKDGTDVLKFIYDIYQGDDLINTHKIYLQIKK